MDSYFNYIVPIFNKEDILPMTLEGIGKCASADAKIFTVIDGCTDRSEQVVDEFAKSSGREVVKIHMPDVHMLRSVNAALKQITRGFSVIMQDDIILDDPRFEDKISSLYRRMGERLGVISLRMASNIALTPVLRQIRTKSLSRLIEEVDFISTKDDPLGVIKGENEYFYPRFSAINGPNVIPWDVRQKVGILDENLAPYGYDDPEYCLRTMKAGFINGLYPLRFRSDIEWGGTRRSKKFRAEVKRIHLRNRKYIWQKHGSYLSSISKSIALFQDSAPVSSLGWIPDLRE